MGLTEDYSAFLGIDRMDIAANAPHDFLHQLHMRGAEHKKRISEVSLSPILPSLATKSTVCCVRRRRRRAMSSVPPRGEVLVAAHLVFFCLVSCASSIALIFPFHAASSSFTRQHVMFRPHNCHSNPSVNLFVNHIGCRRAKSHVTALLDPPQRYKSSDWAENLRSLFDSRIVKRISGHLLFNTAWATGVTGVYESMPQWHIGSDISPVPHQIMSTALGLLLVFRTNAAYDRFWEARKVWGSVTNICRNLARTGRIALDQRYHARFSMLIIAFAVTLRAHLQRNIVSTELETLLPSWEADQVRMDTCPPALVCMKLTYLINEAVSHNEARSDFYALYLEQLVGDLVNCLGMAERILLTPVPASYSRHTSRFLSLYTLTLPFVLVHQLEIFTAPVLGIVCWGLFSIEEIGHLIEEPFCASTKQLPLISMTETIARDVKHLLGLKAGFDVTFPLDENLLSPDDWKLAENGPESALASSISKLSPIEDATSKRRGI